MIKIVYKYVNEFIDEEKLIDELMQIKESICDKYKQDINNLILDIKEIMSKHKNNSVLTYDEIYNLLTNNNTYIDLVNNMSTEDLMLMITDYISARLVPDLSQEEFDEVVDAAIINGKDSKENCWRLAMNYQYHNLNFEKIVDYLISTRDVWYVVELIHSLGDVLNINDIVEKIINTNDKEFIKGLLKDNFIDRTLSEEQMELLKKESIN